MTKQIAQTYDIVYENRMGVARVLMVACLALTLFYAFNLYRVISRTVALEKINSDISTVNNSVTTLDAKYLELSSAITPDTVKQYGFSQAKVSMYVTKTPLTTRSVGSHDGLAVGGHEL